jgi:putative ABC transport system permease protein
LEQELDDELRYHRQRLEDDLVARGLSPRDAHYAALREMGAIEQRKDECRDARGFALLDSLRQDLTYARRALGKSPAFTAVAILSLALGIGANTTIFTFVNAVLLRPLPYPDSGRIVTLRERPLTIEETVNVHPVNFVEWHARARSFEALALVQTPPLTVLSAQGAEQIPRAQITADLFRVFGVAPLLGREFTLEETRSGPDNVVMLGHGFWQRWFGGDPGVIGRQLPVRSGPSTIVGIAPPGFRIGLMEADVLTPLKIDPANPGATGSRAFQAYGRLKSGVGVAGAQAEMSSIAATLSRERRGDGFGVSVFTLHEYLVRDGRPALRLLMAVVATVLVIACANLMALLIARGLQRRSEFALRASLGASRARLIRQLVIESLVLSLLGGAAGLAVAYWATQALVMLSADALRLGVAEPIALDATCLVFTFAVSTVTALAFGLVPALQAGGTDPQVALRERTRGASVDRRQQRMRGMLVAAEVALAVVLLVGASLLLRTFATLVRVDVGFQPAETVTMNLFLGIGSPESRIALVDQILERVEALPGVKAAGTIQFLPLTGLGCNTGVRLEEQIAPGLPGSLDTDCSLVSRGYFAAMGIPVLEGRAFDRRDHAGASRVVMVNRAFARRYFAGATAIGKRVLVQSSNQQWAEIIGVVGDIRHNGLTSEPAPTAFLLHAQTPGYITNLVVRAAGDPGALAAAIRGAIQQVDATQATANVKTMDQYVDAVLARPRLYAMLVSAFAAIALVLAAIGIYGLIAYTVAQRTHEIGIRLALGATRTKVFAGVFRQGALLAVIGLIAGTAGAVALRGMAATLLFGVTAGDPASYTIAGSVLLVVALAAVAIPARRASQVDPLTALRYE